MVNNKNADKIVIIIVYNQHIFQKLIEDLKIKQKAGLMHAAHEMRKNVYEKPKLLQLKYDQIP